MNKRGILITLEGGEGCGKTSMGERVCKHLISLGLLVDSYYEPGGTVIGDKIREILKDKKNKEMSYKTEALLFQASRAQLVEEKIQPSLSEGRIVILDRYGDSSLVYQGIARGLGLNEIRKLTEWTTGNLRPDLSLFFDVDPEVGLRRKGRLRKNDRLDSLGLDFHQMLRDGYLELIRNDESGRWRIIDANWSKKEVYRDVRNTIVRELNFQGFIERPLFSKER